jgi:AraC family transcriptional regulator of adaptative response/methylated-DNA-[protein]-cysteine methyltransferase
METTETFLRRLAREATGREPPARLLYGVRTTGVFCVAGCPSPRPLAANVTFHDTATAARAAGLRPCRRCRPEEPSQAQASRPGA